MLIPSVFKNNPLQVFIFGDYEVLCTLYGITGASGKLLSVFNSAIESFL